MRAASGGGVCVGGALVGLGIEEVGVAFGPNNELQLDSKSPLIKINRSGVFKIQRADFPENIVSIIPTKNPPPLWRGGSVLS